MTTDRIRRQLASQLFLLQAEPSLAVPADRVTHKTHSHVSQLQPTAHAAAKAYFSGFNCIVYLQCNRRLLREPLRVQVPPGLLGRRHHLPCGTGCHTGVSSLQPCKVQERSFAIKCPTGLPAVKVASCCQSTVDLTALLSNHWPRLISACVTAFNHRVRLRSAWFTWPHCFKRAYVPLWQSTGIAALFAGASHQLKVPLLADIGCWQDRWMQCAHVVQPPGACWALWHGEVMCNHRAHVLCTAAVLLFCGV